jgi:O-antigen/teichoic acid export membrane protein
MKFSSGEFIKILQLLLIRGTGMLSLFLVNVIIARNFGPATQGLFQIGLGWVIVVSTMSRFGQDQLMLRTAAEGKARNDVSYVHRQLTASLALAASALILGTLIAVSLIYFGVFKTEGKDAVQFLDIMVLAIVPTGLLMIVTETMRGWQKITLAIAWQGSVPQTLLLMLLLLVVFGPQLLIQKDPIWISIVYSAVYIAAAICAFFVWLHIAKQRPTKPWLSDSLELLKKGSHFWLYAILTSIIAWIDILLLGYLETTETVGHYSAIVRTGAVLGTVVQIVSAGATARLALLYARADYGKFADLFRSYFQLFATCAIPLTLLLFTFPSQIMSIWGNNFVSVVKLFLIYGSFQIINFTMSITGLIVIAIGLEKKLAWLQIGNLAFKSLSIIVGQHLGGLEGVIWAVGISLTASNVITWIVFVSHLNEKKIRLLRLIYNNQE